MKHLLFMLIAVVFAGNLAAQNLLTDPGFENMDPTDWNTTYAGVEMPLKLDVEGWYHRKVANTLIVSDIATDEFHSGSKSAELRINDGAGNFQWYRNIIAQKVSIQLDKKYTATLWAKGNHSIAAVLWTQNADGQWKYPAGGISTYLGCDDEWKQYTITFDIPVNATAHLADGITDEIAQNNTLFCLGLRQRSNTNLVYVYIDDVELQELVETGFSEIPSPEPAAYVDGKKVYFNIDKPSTVSVFSGTGTVVLHKEIVPGESITLPQAGYYVLKVNDVRQPLVKKIVIG